MQTVKEHQRYASLTGPVNEASEETVGQLAAKDLRNAKIFKKYRLDFCCGGKKTVRQACEEKGLDVNQIEAELMEVGSTPATKAMPYDEWNVDFLCDYIVNRHHSYVQKNLPDIRVYAQKVMRVHGKDHPELFPVQQLVEEVHAELMSHMMKEERILFPYIKQLVAAKNNHQSLPLAQFGTVQNPVNMMEMEHEQVGDNFKEIRRLTHDYRLPESACGSYIFLYRMLEEFEEDLYLHIHLENNILFPKALEIEKELNP
jgi:regulator of cell morphogenesis and NO signaling